MRRSALVGLLALSAAACGMPVRPLTGVAAAPAPVSAAASSSIQGAYLSVDLRPHLALYRQARDLRMQLGFLDMGRAVPPRSPEDFHMTVAYFRTLSRNSAQKLAEMYQRHAVNVEVTGWGIANRQAAYFTVHGTEGYRKQIQGAIPEPFSADDPHITFGVSPTNPKDVHGVPKPVQTVIRAVVATGDIHLKQGDDVIW